MSHEWDCRCPRCEADARLDTLEEDEQDERDAFADGRTAYDPHLPFLALRAGPWRDDLPLPRIEAGLAD